MWPQSTCLFIFLSNKPVSFLFVIIISLKCVYACVHVIKSACQLPDTHTSNCHSPYLHTHSDRETHTDKTHLDISAHAHTHTTMVIHHCGEPLCCTVIGCQVGLVLRPVGLSILPVSMAPLGVRMFVVVEHPTRHTFTLIQTHTQTLTLVVQSAIQGTR